MARPFEGKTVLLFEDEEMDEFKAQLEHLGFKVLAYGDYLEIKRMAANNEFPKVDLIVSDNHLWYTDTQADMMVDAEMYDDLKQWKSQPDNPNHNTPIVAITDSNRSISRTLESIQHGFAGFMWKSQRLTDLKKGFLTTPAAVAVLKASMESPKAGMLYVTPFWRDLTLRLLDNPDAFFSPKGLEMRAIEWKRADDKVTQEDADLLRRSLIVPEVTVFPGLEEFVSKSGPTFRAPYPY